MSLVNQWNVWTYYKFSSTLCKLWILPLPALKKKQSSTEKRCISDSNVSTKFITDTWLEANARSPLYYHTAISFFKVQLCFMSQIDPRLKWEVNNAGYAKTNHYKQNSGSCVYLNINATLKPTVHGVIFSREPRRWKTLTNYEFYRQLLSVHEWNHSQQWMGLCATLVLREASLKIQVNSPMRLELEIHHGDKPAWPKHEPEPHIPSRRTGSVGTFGRTSHRLGKTVCFAHAGAFMCCPWLSLRYPHHLIYWADHYKWAN